MVWLKLKICLMITNKYMFYFVAQFADRCLIADLLDIQVFQVQQAEARQADCAIERRCEVRGFMDSFRPSRQRHGPSAAKSGLERSSDRDTPHRIIAFLVHADGPVAAIVDQDHQQVEPARRPPSPAPARSSGNRRRRQRTPPPGP